MTKQIEVVAAVIMRDGLVFCTQRGTGPLAGRWEFPGGQVEPGESARGALRREIREELHCAIAVNDEITTTRHAYDFAVVTLTTFYATLVAGQPRLTEHVDARWLPPDELGDLDWAPADVPAIHLIRDHHHGR